MKNFLDRVLDKIKTHILYSITFFIYFFIFRKSCRLWDNVEKYGKDRQATDDITAHVHCMQVATNTHSEYEMLIAFQRQRWLRERV
jgi:hypothetical protein